MAKTVAGFAIDEFNQVLPEMEAAFTETWTLGGTSYPAISIEKLTVGSKVMRGGQFIDVNTSIFIRKAIFESSGVSKGNVVTARGAQLAVIEIDEDGDDSRTLVCGPSQIDVFTS